MAANPRKRNPFPKGCAVRVERAEPVPAWWPRFAGKTGVVFDPDNQGEIGVRFGAHGTGAMVWFLPTELARVQ